MKKLIGVLLAFAVVAVVLTGCSDKGAESFVKDYYESWIKGDMTAEKSYDEYISQTSKDVLEISRDKYIEEINSNLQNITYKSIKITAVTNYNDTIYKVRCTIDANINGNSQSYSSDEYVINENGEYKFLQYGLQAKQDIETSYSSQEFSMAIDKLYTGPDKVMVNLIAKNATTYAYAVGYGGNARIVVETDQGSYESAIEGTNIVDPIDESQGVHIIDGVKGNIKSITIYNIYELTASNEPKDINNARSYLLYQAKE